MSSIVPMLELDGVGLRFADGTQALDNVSLRIPRGQFCALLGPSGAGKSTLIKIINGLNTPSEGRVSLAGVQRWPQVAKRTYPVATIHQSVDLIERLSVLDNVLCGSLAELSSLRALIGMFGEERQRRACKLLHSVGLLESQLYRRAGELSGGQQQRVGVARAFMSRPAIVLADEPVASLDPRTSREILALLRQASRERDATVVCSLHDVGLAREFADRIVGMRAGRIAFDCGPRDLDVSILDTLYAAAA